MIELPESWSIIALENCVDILDHLRVPINSSDRSKRTGLVPYYGATGRVGYIDDFLFNEELVLVGEDGAPFLDKSKPIAYIVNGKSWVNNHAHVLRANTAITINEFLKHSLDIFDFSNVVTGSTRLKLTQAALRSIPIAIPPLAEQKRIAAKVEELLAQVNSVRGRLQRVPEILKRFRQAVLAAACSGRLTEEFRVEHGDATWSSSALRDLVNSLDQGWSPKCDIEPSLSPDVWGVIKTTAIQSISFVEGENKRLPADLVPRPGLEIKKNDVLITRAGPRARAGVCCLVKEVRPLLMICDKVYRIRVKAEIVLPSYVVFVLNAPEFVESLDDMKTGISDSGVNLTQEKFGGLEIPLPPLLEQQEIVRRVEALFALADRIESRVAVATERAGKLTQSILARAFRGELVPTEAELARREGRDYEPASVLLERIRAKRQDARGDAPKRKSSEKNGRSPGKTRHATEPEIPAMTAEPDHSLAPVASVRNGASAQLSLLEEFQQPIELKARRTDIIELPIEQAMAALRSAARGAGEITEEELLRGAAHRLGYERLGKTIRALLEQYLATALERRIIARNDDHFICPTPTLARYEEEFLITALSSVLRRDYEYEREEVMAAMAEHLGYSALTDAMRERMKPMLTRAIRDGVLGHRGKWVWREG
ncbi:MAG: restriction endonuclease subunit S [Bacteroidota bacterium]